MVYDVDGFRCAPFVVEPPLVRQHFFLFLCAVAPRVYWMEKILQAFFLNFYGRFMLGNSTSSEGKIAAGRNMARAIDALRM
jgi:hypothetical protein